MSRRWREPDPWHDEDLDVSHLPCGLDAAEREEYERLEDWRDAFFDIRDIDGYTERRRQVNDIHITRLSLELMGRPSYWLPAALTLLAVIVFDTITVVATRHEMSGGSRTTFMVASVAMYLVLTAVLHTWRWMHLRNRLDRHDPRMMAAAELEDRYQELNRRWVESPRFQALLHAPSRRLG